MNSSVKIFVSVKRVLFLIKIKIVIEIERKFLIKEENWKPQGDGVKIVQGYLSANPERTVRVRVAGARAFLTIKGKPIGIKRKEFEYEIPKNEGDILLGMCMDFLVEKTRYKERIGNLVWEIDIFEGKNKGLILAEVEIENESQEIQLPNWIKEEVSGDKRYFNSFLVTNPYCTWKD